MTSKGPEFLGCSGGVPDTPYSWLRGMVPVIPSGDLPKVLSYMAGVGVFHRQPPGATQFPVVFKLCRGRAWQKVESRGGMLIFPPQAYPMVVSYHRENKIPLLLVPEEVIYA